MKNLIRSAAVVALMSLGAVAAQAQVQSAEAGFAAEIASAQSSLSRQQVGSEFVQARQGGKLQLAHGDAYAPVNSIKSASLLDRADVKAQAVAANQHGHLLSQGVSVQ
ncbi:DUF4148 domain-containing protein [Diaphorobacter aerolatus]|uniref:DUF4148 domain-containing protein n=1 Tax=Diaphorobacter aerolatus TaxID=1288495 RepID=A0A7H0GG90_9BURK|nr:DUF4148 domain-containing protein [Diaphorobacter aerolatus]QNP47306.1 DUF4148 domain-containing protein [Diaphorobacter aerolatus]